MRRTVPILHVSRLVGDPDDAGRGRLARGTLQRLGRLLGETDFETPGAAGLVAGRVPIASVEVPGLFLTEETRLEELSWWCRSVGLQGWSSLLTCRPAAFGLEGELGRSDIPLLTGHGVILASRGISGEPLVGMEVGRLRRELEESRRQLSGFADYAVRALAPAPTTTGRAFDGLVRREARRAGYELLFEPGDVAALSTPSPEEALAYRTVQAGESERELRNWLVNRPLARTTARLRKLAQTPSAILDRLAPNS